MLERAMAHDKIEFMTNTAVEEVLGVEERKSAVCVCAMWRAAMSRC